jgi:lysophospholipase L1-like esterase
MEPVDENARYPDFLAQEISRKGHAAVVNLGISGNQAVATFIGDNLQARLNRDALTQSGITHLIVQGGINDIGLPGLLTAIGIPTPATSAASIISGLQQIAARTRAAGVVPIVGTLSPSGSVSLPGYSGVEVEAKRQAVNHWIRNNEDYDLFIDFDKVLAEPSDPTIMRADLTADGLHPNSDGYKAMARAAQRALRHAGYVR